MKTVVWFRQDLRLTDNPALSAAARRGTIVPVYVWAPEEEGAFPAGVATEWWLHQSLGALQKSLGGALVLGHGRTPDCLRAVVKVTGAVLFLAGRTTRSAASVQMVVSGRQEIEFGKTASSTSRPSKS